MHPGWGVAVYLRIGGRLLAGHELRQPPLQPVPLVGAHLPRHRKLVAECGRGRGRVHVPAAADAAAELQPYGHLDARGAGRFADVRSVAARWRVVTHSERAVRLELPGSGAVRAHQHGQRILLRGLEVSLLPNRSLWGPSSL